MRMPSPKRSFLPAFLAGLVAAFLLYGLAVHQLTGTSYRKVDKAAHWHKIKRDVANSKEGPRVFILGGSSTSYGFKAKTIEEIIGVPTVNYGLIAGFAHYLFECIKEVARPGDTVLLPLEYELYQTPDTQNTHIYILCYRPEYYHSLSWTEWAYLVLSLSDSSLNDLYYNKLTLPRGFRWDTDEEIRSELDPESGDLVSHEHHQHLLILPVGILNKPTEKILTRESFEEFFAWARENDIKLVATWPNTIYKEQYVSPETLGFIDKVVEMYRENGIPVIGDYRESLQEEDKFFDTHYHLRYSASQKKSREIAPLLKPHLNPAALGPEPAPEADAE